MTSTHKRLNKQATILLLAVLLVVTLLLVSVYSSKDKAENTPVPIQSKQNLDTKIRHQTPSTTITTTNPSKQKQALDFIANEEEELPLSDDSDEVQNSRLSLFTSSISQGDERVPPIVRQAPEEKPSQEELDDPDKYLAFQAKQKQKVLASYLQAAKRKLDRLRKLIAEGERRGISEEQLIEGKAKIRKIEEMVEQMRIKNPELVSNIPPEGPPETK